MKGNAADTDRGRFQAIDSFAIKRRNEFYIIGQLTEGEVQEQWYAHIGLNLSSVLTLRITQIETLTMAGGLESHQLLIVAADAEEIEIMLALNIGSELIIISTQGTE